MALNDKMEVYKVIGSKIYELRKANGLTRKIFANKLGITQQQLHKYENGVNRVSAGRLAQVATILDVDIKVFYENLFKGPSKNSIPKNAIYYSLSKNLMKLSNPAYQNLVKNLVETLVKQEQKDNAA
jgi:transcriptional regulator with XRE-family HTH domain